MNWTNLLTLAAFVVIVLLLRRRGMISLKRAAEFLKQGALVVDVRTVGEFASGHLPRAINLPLDQFEEQLPKRVKDKNQVILLHCQSGMRSGAAKRLAGRLGYSRAYNLGSYGRAAQVVKAK